MLFFLIATPLQRSRRWRKRCSPRAKLVEMAVRRHRLCYSSKTASGFRKSASPFLLSPQRVLFAGSPVWFRLPCHTPPKNSTTAKPWCCFLVEMAVIETASENSPIPLSTCLVYALAFPFLTVHKQAVRIGRLWWMTGYEPLACSPLPLLTPEPRGAVTRSDGTAID